MRDKRIYYILLLSAFLRMFRIHALTEFLGDQGRTSIILRDFSFPLSGPTTLSGAHLGPIFYYILAPFGQSPILGSLWMATLGVASVYFLYKLVSLLYGNSIGLLLALLYGVAPAIIKQDRIIWEPNLVPLFSILFCYAVAKKNAFGVGLATSILVQLHYPNMIFVGLSGLLLIFYFKHIQAYLWWIGGFVLLLLPFLVYEYQHNFIDVINIFQVVNTSSGLGKRQILWYAYEYGGRMVNMMVPLVPPWLFYLAWVILLFLKSSRIMIFLTLWFVVGAFSMARYNGVVYDHYLLFLLPPVLGAIAHALTIKKLRYVIAIIVFLQLLKTDIFTSGNYDIDRTQSAVRAVLTDTKNDPFSFTLINSRSFSDLHYRYYFGNTPKQVTDNNYHTFYLICDNSSCPPMAEVTSKQFIPVVCYDHHCSGEYPVLDMSKWSFVEVLYSDFGSSIYEFQRI